MEFMPIYEYRCRQCGDVFEKILFRDTETAECPSCQGRELERLLSVFAVTGSATRNLERESGPCHCGAPRRGMCGES